MYNEIFKSYVTKRPNLHDTSNACRIWYDFPPFKEKTAKLTPPPTFLVSKSYSMRFRVLHTHIHNYEEILKSICIHYIHVFPCIKFVYTEKIWMSFECIKVSQLDLSLWCSECTFSNHSPLNHDGSTSLCGHAKKRASAWVAFHILHESFQILFAEHLLSPTFWIVLKGVELLVPGTCLYPCSA